MFGWANAENQLGVYTICIYVVKSNAQRTLNIRVVEYVLCFSYYD